MISKESVTLPLAIWGAVVSTATVLWNIMRDVSNKPKVTLWATIARDKGTMGLLSRPVFLTVEIANAGKQAVAIKEIASVRKKGATGRIWNNPMTLPRRLEPTDSIVEEITDFTFITPETTHLHATDSTGKHWFLPKKRLRELIREAKELNLIEKED
jgi:hypothetical protein